MAMTSAGLSAAIKAAIQSEYGGPPPNAFGLQQLQQFCDALGNAIVPYIQANMDISPTAHSGQNLAPDTGQHVAITAGPGAGSTGETNGIGDLIGLGSAL
jgi:hypothetical protein